MCHMHQCKALKKLCQLHDDITQQLQAHYYYNSLTFIQSNSMLLSLNSLTEFSADNYYLEASDITEDKDSENTSYSSLLLLIINFVDDNMQDSVSAVSDLLISISHNSGKMSTISAIKIDIYEKVTQQAA